MCAFFEISDAPAKRIDLQSHTFFIQKPSYVLYTTITLLSSYYHIINISSLYDYHRSIFFFQLQVKVCRYIILEYHSLLMFLSEPSKCKSWLL